MLEKINRANTYLQGIEIMAELENVFTQMDASVYTPIFIPSDEGISPEQEKYQKQVRFVEFLCAGNPSTTRAFAIDPEQALTGAICLVS